MIHEYSNIIEHGFVQMTTIDLLLRLVGETHIYKCSDYPLESEQKQPQWH